MKKIRKTRIITVIILIFILVFPNTAFKGVKGAENSEMYYEEGYYPIFYNEGNKDIFESLEGELPVGTLKTITVGGSTFPFNYRLWFAKNIVVYGDYQTVNPRANDFKGETDSPYNVGYYSKNGVRGEYRYHGFDVSGNRHNNTWWTIDVDTGSSINDNVWLYQPWGRVYNLEHQSSYNMAAERGNNPEEQKTRDWINRPIVKDGVTLTFENAERASEGIYANNYINIMSPPTINYPGEARGWHKHDNQILYRTFTINKLEHLDKLMTDVNTSVKILTPDEKLTIQDFGGGIYGNTPEYLDSEIEVEVEVSSRLLDEEYYNDPVKRTARYTRDDIKDWTISLGGEIRNNIESVDYNKGRAVFKLKYKVESVLNQNTYTVNGNARVNFKNNKSNEDAGSTSLKFTVVEIPPRVVKDKLMTDLEIELEIVSRPEFQNIMDYGEIMGPEYLDGFVNIEVKVRGILLDDSFYNNPEEKDRYYNRDDIVRWDISLDGMTESVIPNIYDRNAGENTFTIQFRRRSIFEQRIWSLSGYVKVYFYDGKGNIDHSVIDIVFTISDAPGGSVPKIEDIEVIPPPEPVPPPVIVRPLCHIPDTGFDMVAFPAHDETDMETVSKRRVYINGDEVDGDLFFSGDYIFGDGMDGVKKIEVIYESTEEIISSSIHWTYIYDTKPTAQFKLNGIFKENRKLTAVENCEIGNSSVVLDQYPIVSYEWNFISVDGLNSSFKLKSPTNDGSREFLYKAPGVYRVKLTVTNVLGRVSKPYVLDFVIYEDVPPAIEMNIWNGVLTRGEKLKLHYSASSVDGDHIEAKTLNLYYDSNNDGICDQLIKTFPNGEFTGYTPDKLGRYKLVATVREEFGQETIPQFITLADKKTKTIESEFYVDNLVPMTDIYIDAPVVRPEIDMYIMMDKNLNDTKRQYIIANRVNFNNFLRTKNIMPKIETWDMKTYEYSQTTSDTRHTGTSIPPDSIPYLSDGYSGILNLNRTIDNGSYETYYRSETKMEYRTFTDSNSYTVTIKYRDGIETSRSGTSCSDRIYISEDGYSGYIYGTESGPSTSESTSYDTESRYFTAEHSNTVSDWYHKNGTSQSYETSPAPSEYYISEGGYSGYIPRTGTRGPYDYEHITNGDFDIYVQTWVAEYSGYLYKNIPLVTVYKTYTVSYRGELSKQVSVSVPYEEWESDYIGYYSGTVSKSVRQPYQDPFRATSDKYVVYISDGGVNELSDLEGVMSKSDAALILIGNSAIKDQISNTEMSYEHYISKDKPMEEIISEVLDYIALNSPAIEKHYVLAGTDTFNIKTMNFDEEGDPIIEEKFQYVQNQNYFDNPTGIENTARTEFSETGGWVDTKAIKFDNAGEYRIFRRIKDRPTTDPDFAGYSYYSGTPEIRIYAHRKPIAKAELDWDYDSGKGKYKTRWECASYDPDHQYSREDKGIVEKKIMFRRVGGEWHYYIPEELDPGNYQLEYYVKDLEGVWSEPYILNFTLETVPSIQFDAKLRTLDSDFSLNSIPAIEYLEVYDAWTRYPYNVKLETVLYRGSVKAGPIETVNPGFATGSKVGNDIYWNNISYKIPGTQPDGEHTFKILAMDTSNTSKFVQKEFPVKIYTPINLLPSIPETVMTEDKILIEGETTKYTNNVRIDLYHGTPYASTMYMTGNQAGNLKEWRSNHTVPSSIPEGTYTARFTATTPAGKSEVREVQYTVETVKITGVTLEGYWNHWRGQVDIFGSQLTDEPHRFLGLEKVKINIQTDGYADKIEIRFSPELEAMEFKDINDNIYNYKEDFGLQYISFPKTFVLDNTIKENQIYWEYTLPLAESTKSWKNEKLRAPYRMEVRAWKGGKSIEYIIDDISMTGNIYDLTYIQPID